MWREFFSMFGYSLFGFLMLLGFIVDSLQGNVSHHNYPMLLYSTTKDIRLVHSNRTNKLKTHFIVKNYTYIPAIDYHFEKQKIFWVDHNLQSIFSIDYDGTETKNKTEIVNGVFMPDGLACDWFTNKIYWTDSETNRIEVATIDGHHRKVLFWTDFDQPRAIAVAPTEGYLFWTDWGESPKIERAGMDGTQNSRKVIVSDNIFWPNGLTIDYKTKLVYWIDGKLKFIKKMDYNGNNEQMVLDKGFEYPFSLTQFETKLFWTDWKTMAIHHYDTATNQKPSELLATQHPMDIHVWDQRHQPKQSHPCENNNGGCSHLCLLSPDPPGYTCACPIGIKLVDNKTCADGPQEMLLLARRTDICLIYLDSPEYSYKVLPLADVKYSIAIDYDPLEGFVYWSDDEVKKIQLAKLNGNNQQDLMFTEIQNPDGIALDWIARNIYWTDTGTDRIEVARLTGGYRKVVIMDKLVDPRGIAVASELGWLFWSDWNEKEPKIERSNLDGSERNQIVREGLGWPNGITLDFDNLRIYWCDAKEDVIEYAKMDGTERRKLISDYVPHVFGLTLLGDYLYWTDWQRRAIDRAHKETGSQREVIVDQLENVMGLKAITMQPAKATKNPCRDNNGNCSQLCFYRHNQSRVCTCQIDYELAADKQTCVKPETFLLYTKRDGIGRIGIENEDNEVVIPITGIKHATAIDFDTNTNRIYWCDSKLHTIMRAYINGSDPQRVIDLGLSSPEGIAVDWLGLNVYWTDPAAHRIEVSRLVGTSRRTLLWSNEPHSIVLDPIAGYMYWSEWGMPNCIKKAAMDGRNQIKLVSTVNPAASLTLDSDKRRLYWVERNPDSPLIVSSDLDGNDRRQIISENIFQPIGLTLYNDYIFWSENKTNEILRAYKTDGSSREVIYNNIEGVTDLLVYHKHKQKQANQCATSNGGCSHLCLALPAEGSDKQIGYTCACPTHYILEEKECRPPTNFMIYSQRNLAVRLLPDISDCPEAVLPIQGLKAVKAIDFDTKSNFLYWIDNKSHSIKKSQASGQLEPSGQPYSIVVHSAQDVVPFDLAIDVIGRLLFWTCSSKDVITITRLDDTNPFGVLDRKEGEKPRLLAIHMTKRLLFYTDIGMTPQLVRTRLDGSQKLMITKADDIAAVAVDTENDLIVWAQGHSIYISNIDGENQHVVVNESNSKIIQLTVHSGWLYWIDKELHQIQRLELRHGKSRSSLVIQATHVIDLISVKHPGNHSCNLPHNKQCSHFCILDIDKQVCACPNGKVLQEDNRTCQILPDCGIDRFTCNVADGAQKDCIPISWRCDQQKDCTDGSDEEDCPQCLPDQFRCQDGQCINKDNYCDNQDHCKDKSDEKNCCPNGFQCPQTEVCLSTSFICDGNENCADGSDEKDCLSRRDSYRDSASFTNTVIISVTVVVIVFILCIIIFLRKKFLPREDINDQSEDSLSPMHPNLGKNHKLRKGVGIPDVVRMSMLNDSGCPSTYDRRHLTGASSSSNTNGSSITCYPRETLNPPPSPATTAASTRGSSPSSRYRPYRHYRSINQPPPPTPCSTDICDESDYNYPLRGPFPPPPTPRSHCHQDSCPPSPSSRSSTYFSPFPPPPSPVASPRGGYDS